MNRMTRKHHTIIEAPTLGSQDGLSVQLAQWISFQDDSKPASWFVWVYDDEGVRIGETSPQGLLLALLRGDHQMDMFSEQAGGSVPVDISSISKLYVYIG